MKIAEEYIGNWKEVLSTSRTSLKITPVRMVLVEHAVKAINEARKETIEACSEIANDQLILSHPEYIGQAFKKLIKELK